MIPIARYRSKDDVDLAWNKIRRRLTRELDTQIADVREEILDRLLTEGWTEFKKALERGETLELESRHEAAFVRDVLTGVIDVKVERPRAVK